MAVGRHPQWNELSLSGLLGLGAALVVIDPTNAVLHQEGAQSGDGLWQRARASGGSLEGILHLVRVARAHRLPVGWLRYEYLRQQYPATPLEEAQRRYWYANRMWTEEKKGWEGDLVDELRVELREGDLDAAYTSFGNVFHGSPLLPALNSWGARTLLIAGYHLDQCVEQAARTARDFGFVPIVVGDASGAVDPEDEEPTLRRIDSYWAPVVSYRDLQPADKE